MFGVLRRKAGHFIALGREKGWPRALRIAVDLSVVSLLARVHRFPASWHAPTSLRPYRIMIAREIDALEPQVVCEVGCGLGSILSRVHAPLRIGYDISPGVVDAARLIRSRAIGFRVGTLGDVDLERMDVLMLVNWIHEVSPDDLARQLLPLLPRTRYLMLDAIDADNTFGYRYKHDFAFLAGKAELVSSSRHPGEGRSFRLFRVRP